MERRAGQSHLFFLQYAYNSECRTILTIQKSGYNTAKLMVMIDWSSQLSNTEDLRGQHLLKLSSKRKEELESVGRTMK